jgi:hypothetical protein
VILRPRIRYETPKSLSNKAFMPYPQDAIYCTPEQFRVSGVRKKVQVSSSVVRLVFVVPKGRTLSRFLSPTYKLRLLIDIPVVEKEVSKLVSLIE